MAVDASLLPGGGAAPWTTRAEIRRARGDLQASMRDFLEALRADPHDPWAWVGLGELLIEMGAIDDARGPLDRAARLAPGSGRH